MDKETDSNNNMAGILTTPQLAEQDFVFLLQSVSMFGEISHHFLSQQKEGERQFTQRE